ncbi:MAG: sugar transferase [Chitinophagaceae bacterium]|nr:MAG: sugar transferase [Chitinophagaceae bacterium]
MFTNVLPQGTNEVIVNGQSAATKEKFFYIGNASFFKESLQPLYSDIHFSGNIEAGKKLLAQLDHVPDVIILDVPHNHIELVAFKVWLLAQQLNEIPIIYNQAYLSGRDTKLLFSQKLVDDVINLEQHFSKLSSKIKFFKRVNHINPSNKPAQKTITLPTACRFCFIKRTSDILVATVAIILCSPLFLIIPILIKFDSRGPVFYLSKRAGRGFGIFNFFKFRTMVVNAQDQMDDLADLNQYSNEAKAPVFYKLQNDPRITKIGKFLRNTSLDELPQLFNVLRGDMSIVGNRPLPLYEASTLTTDEWAERFMAPAGITGLWQVSKRGKADMSNEERIQLDITYARTRTLMTDFRILMRTPGALLQKADV